MENLKQLTQEELKVGLILWDQDRNYPIIISYMNIDNNCVRWICLHDNKETENIPIIREGKFNRRFEDMMPSDEKKVHKYLDVRQNNALNKIYESLKELHEAQRQHENAMQEFSAELAFKKNIDITIEKFYGKLSAD